MKSINRVPKNKARKVWRRIKIYFLKPASSFCKRIFFLIEKYLKNGVREIHLDI